MWDRLRHPFRRKRIINIEARIDLGFVFTIALMLALTGVGLTQMYRADARLKNIVEKNNVKTELARVMQTALRERALRMHSMAVLTDDFLKDEEYQHFNELGGKYVQARQQLEKLADSDEEKKIFSLIVSLTRAAQPEVEKVMEMSLRGNDAQIFDLIRGKAMPRQRAISDQVDVLIQFQQAQTAEAVREAEVSSAGARNAMLFLGALACTLTIIMATYVSRRVKNQTLTLERQALYDELTGLPNRTLFYDRLRQAIKTSKRLSSSFAIILMDLDRFKEVNDTLGHDAGDLLLKEVGRRLKETVRNVDTVARLGGDEYVILLENLSDQHIQAVANKISESQRRAFLLAGEVVHISASLGIARFPDHGEDAETVMRRADLAMYAAKHQQQSFAIYSETLEHHSRTDLALKNELRLALERDELVLHYQPKIDHATGKVMGVEALVRWQHPQRGFLSPELFIPIAEEAGLIEPLTREVVGKALAQCARLHQAGMMMDVAVNLSTRNLRDKHLPAHLASLLASLNMNPAHLMLEITESTVLAEPDFALEMLHQLDQIGVTLAIDDFGTGYSSLAYLSKMPIDEIKIDKSFILDMLRDKQSAVVVRSTIDLGHNLGLKVVAEGVENQEVWDRLTLWGCDTAQGYYMSRPLPEEKLMLWLQDSSWAQFKHSPTPASV